MKFLYQKFRAKRGQKVQVEFSRPTKVKMFASREFDRYKNCRTNSYFGGQYEDSPAIFEVPNDGEWVAVIEKGPMAAPIEVEGKVTLLGEEVEVEVTRALDAPEPKAIPQPKAEAVSEEVEEEAEDEQSAEDEEAVEEAEEEKKEE